MTHEEALDRVQKLLRLAKSDNANEAATAAAMAQKIIDRHRLDVALLNEDSDKEAIQDFRTDLLDSSTSTWKMRLGSVLAQNNGCKLYVYGKEGLSLIGRKSDAQTVRYMYAYLSKEIDRLTILHGKGNGKTWCNNFRLGVVDTIGIRLVQQKEESRQEAQADAFARWGEEGLNKLNSALVRVNQSALEAEIWATANLKLKPISRPTRVDHDARSAGRREGQNVDLGGGKSGIGAGARQIGSGE